MGGGGPVGGNPTSIGAGGSQLSAAARRVAVRSTGISRAASQGESGSGGSVVAASLARFAAAYGEFTDDVGTELTALATLATNGAADLAVAGTGGGRIPRAD